MGTRDAGEGFDLGNDAEILRINSPRQYVGGPYEVVYKNIQERWVIATMDWDERHVLGMRSFWAGGGQPISNGWATWMIAPSIVVEALRGINELSDTVERFLDDEEVYEQQKSVQ